MNSKPRLAFYGAALLCVMLLSHQLLASRGPLRRLLNRRPAPPEIVTQVEAPPLRVGGKLPFPVLNIAHRGASAFAPENTLESFRLAIELGCHMLELDVHHSKDRELIVIHDDEFTRTSNVKTKHPKRDTYFVSDFTAVEIAQFDAGSWYLAELDKSPQKRERFLKSLTTDEEKKFLTKEVRAHYASGKVKHPTLRQVLQLAKDKNVFVNIEPKTLPRQYPGLTADIVKLIEDMKMEHRIIISSFDHDALVEVRRLNKTIATGALVSDRLHNPGKYIREFLDADAYHPGNYADYDVFGLHSIDKKLTLEPLHSARRAGLGVNVWTVNDPGEMEKLIDAGATGLITDYPHRLRDVLAKKAKGMN
jgi:glycerophosphoryl diester phosphodiesterase